MRSSLGCVIALAGFGVATGCGFGAPSGATPTDDGIPVADARIGEDGELDASAVDAAPGADAASGVDAMIVPCTGTPDHDSDGLRDDCDLCPHIASAALPQPDDDGDGVGDACDPRLGNPMDQRVLFDDFSGNSLSSAWLDLATTDSRFDPWTVSGGFATAGSKDKFGALLGTAPVDHPTVTTEVVVTSFTRAGTTMGTPYNPFVEAVVGVGPPTGTDSLGCLVAQLQDLSTQAQTYSAYNNSPMDAVAVSPVAFANNARFRIYGSAGTTLACKFGATELPSISVAIGSGAPTTGFGVAKFLAATKIDYVFVVGHRP